MKIGTNILDNYDKKIIRQLIFDPRISDNQIAKKSGVPVKTVNRKRKRLEQAGILKYMTTVENGPQGTQDFGAQVMYLIKFRYGVFRKLFTDVYDQQKMLSGFQKHIKYKWLGEKDGQLILIIMMESREYSDMLEILNVEIVGSLHKHLGYDAVQEIMTIPIAKELSILHNYPMDSFKLGKLDPKKEIFISDTK